MSVVAKFFCNKAAKSVSQWSPDYPTVELEMSVVSGQTPEDQIFHQASPGGEIKLTIANPAAQEYFQPGKKYKVTFEEVQEG
jgi:hypothetical protein